MNTNFKMITGAALGVLLLVIMYYTFKSDSNSAPVPTYSCGWDHTISNALGNDAMKVWRGKWTYENQQGQAIFVPDSFYVSKKALKKLVGKSCGFYATYGLTDTSNISTMCITLSPVGSKQDSVLFLDASSALPDEGPTQKATYISRKKAKKYHTLWELYNGICLENDTLGRATCRYFYKPGQIPPGGKLAEGILDSLVTQIVPISQAYSADSVFTIFGDAYGNNYEGIYFLSAMFPSEHMNSLANVYKNPPNQLFTFIYDFVLKARVKQNGGFVSKGLPSVKNQNGDDVDVDRSCPCPADPDCCPPDS